MILSRLNRRQASIPPEPPAPPTSSQVLTARVPNPEVEFIKELSAATGCTTSALLTSMVRYFESRRFQLPLDSIFKPSRRGRPQR